jgi:hypothetical protein
MKKLILLMLVSFSFIQAYASDDAVMCTMDAMQCSDWSWVGRSWPNCEFVCPWENTQKACTREYAPVCGEVQVQCIKAPCDPAKETFSNRCEMENNSLATFLHEWTCEDNQEEVFACPMIYSPVCWNDWETYSNSCMAQKVWVKYNSNCIWEKLETKVYDAWKKSVDKNIWKVDNKKKIVFFEKLIAKIDKILEKENFESKKYWVYNFLKYLIWNDLENIAK